MDSAGSGSHIDWAGGKRATLAIVFTDAKDSTDLAENLGDEVMNEIWDAHFDQSRHLITSHKGRSIKGLGDGVMAVFRNVEDALDYALALHADPGHPVIKLRAAIHIGPVNAGPGLAMR
jgi:adenylate cyclase